MKDSQLKENNLWQRMLAPTIVINIIVGLVFGALVALSGLYFLRNIQPYVEAQNILGNRVTHLEAWKEGHEHLTKKIEGHLEKCPTKEELAPKFKSIDDKLEDLRKSQQETNGKVTTIYEWVLDH